MYAVNIATREVRFLVNSNLLFVIDECADEELLDLLIVSPHHGAHVLNFHNVDPLDWMFVVDRTGKSVGVIGDFDDFMKTFCSRIPAGALRHKLNRRPPRWQQLTCQDRVVRAYTIYLLDGGSWTEFDSLLEDKSGFSPDWAANDYIKQHCPGKLLP